MRDRCLEVMDFATLGSSLSLRSFTKLGSMVSVFGESRFNDALSVLAGTEPRRPIA